MASVNSSNFTINVNRSTSGELGANGRVQSTIVVYKGSQRLSPVSSTPTTGQFKVTISSQDGCSASIKENDTVYVNSMSSTNATITLNINVENAVNFQKNINLVKSISNEEISNIESRVSVAEQKITEDAITNVVSKKFYTKDQTNTQISSKVSTVQQTVDSWGVRISQNETDISSLKLTDEQFSVEIGGKADKSNIISMINASTEGITISSSKVNISGFVTFSDLSTSGRTTINGGNITSGIIRGIEIISSVNDNTNRVSMVGDGNYYYSPIKLAGKIAFDSNGEGTEWSAKDRFLIQSLNQYVLKLLSTGDMSLTSYDAIYFEANKMQTNCDLDLGKKKLDCGNIYCSNNITCTSITSVSEITAPSVSVTTLSAGSFSVTGNSWLGFLSCGNLECSKVTCTGTINTSGSLQGYTCSIANNMSVDNNAWIKYLYVNGTQVTSDETLKTDIKYVNIDKQAISEDSGLMSPNVNITTSDMHEFIETLPMVSYRLIDDVEKGKDETYYGFLAQEILYSKVGSELVTVPTIEEQELVGDKLRYSETKYISFIAGALQEEIKQRKALENRVLALEDKLNN